eukprot:366256-Chlamydomonas_euryale.AAC.24
MHTPGGGRAELQVCLVDECKMGSKQDLQGVAVDTIRSSMPAAAPAPSFPQLAHLGPAPQTPCPSARPSPLAPPLHTPSSSTLFT